MPDLIAVKRLTKSDITFFARHYRAQRASGDTTAQKSINLNRDIFINQLFPELPVTEAPDGGRDGDLFGNRLFPGSAGTGAPAGGRDRFRFDMLIYGPGKGRPRPTNVMIKKSQKNWRLNGFVQDFRDEPERFAHLVPGDLVLMEFVGEDAPRDGRLGFIHNEDPIFGYLDEFLGERPMATIRRDSLSEMMDHGGLSQADPMRAFSRNIELLHKQVLVKLDDLEKALDQPRSEEAQPRPAGIGHNGPPDPLTDEEIAELRAALKVLKAQQTGPSNIPIEAPTEAAAKIETFKEKVIAYLAEQANTLVKEMVKAIGGELGKRVVQIPFWTTVGAALVGAAHAAEAWLSALPH